MGGCWWCTQYRAVPGNFKLKAHRHRHSLFILLWYPHFTKKNHIPLFTFTLTCPLTGKVARSTSLTTTGQARSIGRWPAAACVACKSSPVWSCSCPVQSILSCPVRSSMVRSGPVQSSLVLSSPVQHGPVRSGPVRSSPVRSGSFQSCPVQSSPVLSCPVQSSLVLSSPVRSGSFQFCKMISKKQQTKNNNNH